MASVNRNLPAPPSEYKPERFRFIFRQIENILNFIKIDTTVPYKVVTSAAVSLAVDDHFVVVDTTSNSVTVTLDEVTDSAIVDKREFIFKKISAANTMTISAGGTDTIDGAASYATTANYSSVTIRAVDGGWYIIAEVP